MKSIRAVCGILFVLARIAGLVLLVLAHGVELNFHRIHSDWCGSSSSGAVSHI